MFAKKSSRCSTMNSALFHAARPGDIRSGGLGVGGGGAGRETRSGMREAAAVAKEMGFGQDFGPQVGLPVVSSGHIRI